MFSSTERKNFAIVFIVNKKMIGFRENQFREYNCHDNNTTKNINHVKVQCFDHEKIQISPKLDL